MPVRVNWGTQNEHFLFDLPDPSTPLGTIREIIAAHIDVAPDTFKIVHDGALILDNNAPISHYAIRHDSILQLVTPTGESDEERLKITAIKEQLVAIRVLGNELARFTQRESQSQATYTKQLAYFQESFTQLLLRLDATDLQKNWVHARALRKEGVASAQAFLDRIDAART
ncbi:hypothetical protein CVT24_003349 [Panaeolus cyanescens]|uniref:BAG domain-containing protein n=1 Tax=Panaeolus cyanescens TaxID=181874 RepID=A0A409Y6W7_9AGAR|nr:hypothetical protein CVT24_003349 [Panaeolus cyanescens]